MNQLQQPAGQNSAVDVALSGSVHLPPCSLLLRGASILKDSFNYLHSKCSLFFRLNEKDEMLGGGRNNTNKLQAAGQPVP